MNPRTLAFWKWRLKTTPTAKPAPSLGFLEVIPPPRPPVSVMESVELEFPSGVLLRVPSDVTSDRRRELVAVMETRA